MTEQQPVPSSGRPDDVDTDVDGDVDADVDEGASGDSAAATGDGAA